MDAKQLFIFVFGITLGFMVIPVLAWIDWKAKEWVRPATEFTEIARGMTLTGYLWSGPPMSAWKRLILFWFYVPLLIWRFLIGKPVLLAEYDFEVN